MKVTTIIEHEDGGASVMLEDIKPYELEALVQAGFATLLEKYANELEEKKKVPAILRGNDA